MSKLINRFALSFAAVLAVSGCHSAFVEATLENDGSTPVSLVEVDYPSASFGIQTLAPHAQYHYRFKIQGSDALKLSFTDSGGQIHSFTGPEIHAGQEGTLRIIIDSPSQAHFVPQLIAK